MGRGLTLVIIVAVAIMQEQGDIQHDHSSGHHAGAGARGGEVMTGQFGTPAISLPDTGHRIYSSNAVSINMKHND